MKSFKLPNLEDEKTVLKTIRLKAKLFERVEELSAKTNISINRIINECIEYALDNMEDTESEDNK